MGFLLTSVGHPTYWYTDYRSRWHRSKFTKKNCVKLVMELPENSITESELLSMTENTIANYILGMDRIWDCGQDTWVWCR